MTPRRLLLFLAILLSFAACARRERPPVILISIDTLRADRLGPGMPRVSQFARDAVVYRNAWSHVPLTLPSHLSIFTGLLPPEHGVRDNAGYRFDAHAHPTLAQLLHDDGYCTVGAVSSYVLRKSTGAGSGFDAYDDAIPMISGAPAGALQRSGDATERALEQLIASGDDAKPLFAFLHLYEPHTPYEPTYDADVARADAIVGRFLDFLKQRNLYDRALIVVLSDHGEGLMDHGEQEHGVFLYREALHVPLVVKFPHAARRGDDTTPTQLIDVMPLILGKPRRHPGSIYSESLYPRIHLGWSELRSLVRGDRHYIDAPRAELFDVARDPRERANLTATDRRATNELRTSLQQFGSAFTQPDAIAPEEAKKLAALGYVSAGADASGPLPDPKDRIADLATLKTIAATHDPRAQIAAIEPLLAANPRWSDLRDQLGAAYTAIGDHTRAAATYESGITATPRLAPQFARSAAESLLLAGNLARAGELAKLAADGGAPGAHLLLGDIALARHDLARAMAEGREAEGEDGGYAVFLEARVAAANRDYDGALALLDRVRASGTMPPHVHTVAADALAHRGRFDDAQREFEAAVADDPHDLEAWSDYLLLLFATRQRDALNRTISRMTEKNRGADATRIAADWRRRVSE